MGEFFRGWKRKVALVPLAIAIAMTAAWLRSWTAHDAVTFSFQKCGHKIDTGYGRIHWLSRSFPNGFDISALYPFDWSSDAIEGPRLELGDSLLERLGFFLNRDAEIGYFEMMVPYWSITAPLIALSAYLLISKPRVPKLTARVNPSDRPPTEVA